MCLLDGFLFRVGTLSTSLGSAKRRVHLATLVGDVLMARSVLLRISPHALLHVFGQCLTVEMLLHMTHSQSIPLGTSVGAGGSGLVLGGTALLPSGEKAIFQCV